VANTLSALRNGAVGFIGWLGDFTFIRVFVCAEKQLAELSQTLWCNVYFDVADARSEKSRGRLSEDEL
jgi:hypothetical protein